MMSPPSQSASSRARSAERAQRRALEQRRRSRLLLWILPIVAILVIGIWLVVQYLLVRDARWRQLVHELHEPMTADRAPARDALIEWGPEIVDDLEALLQTDTGRFGYPTVEVLDALGASDRVPPEARVGFCLDVIARDPGGWNYDARTALAQLVSLGDLALLRSAEAVADWGVWDLSSPSLAAVANLAIASESEVVVEAWAPLLLDRRPARAVRICDVAAYVLMEHWGLPQLMWRVGMPELRGDEELDLHFLAPIFSEARGLGFEIRDRIVDHMQSLVEAPGEGRLERTIEQMLIWREMGPIGDEIGWELLGAGWLRRLESISGRELEGWPAAREWWASARGRSQRAWLEAAAREMTGQERLEDADLLALLERGGRASQIAHRLLVLRTGQDVWDVPAYFAWQRRTETDIAERLRGPWEELWGSLPARWIVRWPLDQDESSEVRRGVDLELEVSAEEAREMLASLPAEERARLADIEERVFEALVRFQRSNYERRELGPRAVPWTHLVWVDEGEVLPEDIEERWRAVVE